MSSDPNDFLLGGGIPACKFPIIGTTVKGTVANSEVVQQTEFATGTPKTYTDGNPMMQVVITLATDERDPQIDGDDGQRKLYVKGQMRQAVAEALRKAGAKLEKGGVLAVQYVEDKPSETRGFNPTKVYRAQYAAASPTAAANDALLGEQAPQPAGVGAGDLL